MGENQPSAFHIVAFFFLLFFFNITCVNQLPNSLWESKPTEPFAHQSFWFGSCAQSQSCCCSLTTESIKVFGLMGSK